MRRTIAYGLVGTIALLLIGAFAYAQLVSVYSPDSRGNVRIDRVSLDQIRVWICSPQFTRWTNMKGLAEWLDNKGVDIDDLRDQCATLSTKERLSITGRGAVTKTLTPIQVYNPEGSAIHSIECDLDDKELEFKITNTGRHNWFLIDQELTTGTGTSQSKRFSNALEEAKPVKLFVNNFLVNSLNPKFWFGEKLFYGHGENFADACKADFLRTERTVKCDMRPVPLRMGVLMNDYMLITPSFVERGRFVCD